MSSAVPRSTREPSAHFLPNKIGLYQSQPEKARRLIAGAGQAAKLVDTAQLDQPRLAELAAWFHLANVLLNLDEAITKN